MPIALAIPIGVLFSIAFLYACSYAYGWSFGAMLQAIIAGIHKLPKVPLGFTSIGFDFLAAPFEAVDHAIRHALGKGIEAMQGVWNYAMGYMAHAISETAEAIAGTAEDTLRALDHFKRYVIPATIGALLGPVGQIAYSLRHRIVHAIQVAIAAALRELHRLEHLTVTKAAAVAGVLPLPRLGRLERETDSLGKRLTNLAHRFSPAVVVGLIGATIFKSFDLGWLRCRGVGRVGKSLCGASGLIEALFADAIDVLLVTNLCELVTLMTKGARFAEPAIDQIVQNIDGLIQCQGATRPKAITVQWFAPPPATNPIAL